MFMNSVGIWNRPLRTPRSCYDQQMSVVWTQEVLGGPGYLWRSQTCFVVGIRSHMGSRFLHGFYPSSLYPRRCSQQACSWHAGPAWMVCICGRGHSSPAVQPVCSQSLWALGTWRAGRESPTMRENLPCSPGCSRSGSLGVAGPM